LLQRKGIETVAIRTGPVRGWQRAPEIKVIAGNPSTETIHRENGCLFKLDVARMIFSKGNIFERARIPRLVREGEVVVDMFAGVGQFSIPIAKHARPAKIYAVEKNRETFGYLLENIRMNKVGHLIHPIFGDCKEVAPRGVADRVIMGIIHVTHTYLPTAIDVLKPSGGIIHYHETVPYRMLFDRPVKRILNATEGREVKIIERRVVKKYSPNIAHVVIDAWIGPKESEKNAH
ncbi:MAG: class I SAM-dependent methyltransferase family protein, partial [Candidatus Hadarchaeales archaeon]